MMRFPKVSVVTITRNDLLNLAKTIDSVTSQDYPNLEYIIVDGDSTDGTFEFLESKQAHFDKWISEPDRGIYDAMNKGTYLSTGDWIIFMNSGDRFYSSTTIFEVFNSKEVHGFDLIGGRCAFTNTDGDTTTEFPMRPVEEIWKGMPVSHQAIFSKRSLLLERPFSLEFKIASDFQFLYSTIYAGASFKILDLFIATTDQEGLSRSNRMLSIKERKHIVTSSDTRITVYLFFIGLQAKTLLRALATRILPSHISGYLISKLGREKAFKRFKLK